MSDVAAAKKDHELTVTVHDEDDGGIFHIAGNPQDQVQAVVDRLYHDHLHRERLDGDRLRCDGSGDDVFSHLSQHLRAYESTHCHALVWNFIGDQGGAIE
jgi:hypothetical protein